MWEERNRSCCWRFLFFQKYIFWPIQSNPIFFFFFLNDEILFNFFSFLSLTIEYQIFIYFRIVFALTNFFFRIVFYTGLWSVNYFLNIIFFVLCKLLSAGLNFNVIMCLRLNLNSIERQTFFKSFNGDVYSRLDLNSKFWLC